MAAEKRGGGWTLEKVNLRKSSFETVVKQTTALLIVWAVSVSSAQDRLAESDTIAFSQIGIVPGDTLPDFKGTNGQGTMVDYASLRGKRKLVLFFFRGYW